MQKYFRGLETSEFREAPPRGYGGRLRPPDDLPPLGLPELTYHRSQLVQECERGGDQVCGILQPGVAMAAEPECPAGKLGQSREQAELRAQASYSHIAL
jgi:hypothetical protein